ncbi:toll/interleukin-1 receptor domain-containing protein [Methylobacterium sp. WL7]|uniref:toll/interleukin-1 receptor domain-containing protein n=1 Tax=Methylobacterium sp. WL7 TaxID=2603900 RepID=UPI00164EE7DB|nr:toll/interleukin-1 receptor domain-containing protein [Methylobacterium sp. WL7]
MNLDVERRWIFISHSSRDQKIADALRQAIENRGFVCWISGRDIGPGEGFQDVIVRSLQQSYAMLLVFTQNANNSQEIKKEVALASQFNVPIIPIRAEDVLPSNAFKYELATRQWVDAFQNWERAIAVICNKLKTIAPPTLEPTKTSGGVLDEANITGIRPTWKWIAIGAPVLLFAAVGILLAPALLHLFKPGADDAQPQFPETQATRLSAFTMQTSSTEYKAGTRDWVRVAPDRWVERYADGTQNFMRVLKRIHLNECDGTVVSRSENADIEFFLPDRHCSDLVFQFRRKPNGAWVTYTQMENVR